MPPGQVANNTVPEVTAAGLPTLPATQLVTPMGLDPQDIPWLISLIVQGNVFLLDRRLLVNMNTNVAVGPSYMLHTFQHGDTVVAVKQYHQPKDVIHELHQLLVTPPSPFILKLHGIVQLGERGLTCLATEYHPIGSLRQYIAGYRMQLSALHQMQIIHDIISGLECLHQRGTLHMNLHSANVLISREGIALLTDFGKPNSRAEVGMPPKPTLEQERARSLAAVFMAPEILAGNSFSNLSEVYALGMIMFELLTGKVPFEQDHGSPNLASRIMFGRKETIPTSITGSPGPAYEALIKDCWTLEPEKRPHLSIVKARLEELMEQIRAHQRVPSTLQATQQPQHQHQPQPSYGSNTEQQQQHQVISATVSSLSQPALNVYTKVVVSNSANKAPKAPSTAGHTVASAPKSEAKEDRKPVETWTIGFTPATVAKDRDALPLGATPPANQTLPAGTATSNVVSYVIAPTTAAPFDPVQTIAQAPASTTSTPQPKHQTDNPALGSQAPNLQRLPSDQSSTNITTYTTYSEPSSPFDGIYPSAAFSMLNQSIQQAVLPQQNFQLQGQPLPELHLPLERQTQLEQGQQQKQQQQSLLDQHSPLETIKANGSRGFYPLPPGHIAARTSSVPSSPPTAPLAQLPLTSSDNASSPNGTTVSGATSPSSNVPTTLMSTKEEILTPTSPVSPLNPGRADQGSHSSSMDAFFQKWSTISSMPDVKSEHTADMNSRSMDLSSIPTEITSSNMSKRVSTQSTMFEAVIVSDYQQIESTTISSPPKSVTDQLQQTSLITPEMVAPSAGAPFAASVPQAVSSPTASTSPSATVPTTPATITTSLPQENKPIVTSPVVAAIAQERSEWRMGRESVLILPVFPQPPATLHNRRLPSLESLVPKHKTSNSKLSSLTEHAGSSGSMSSMSTEESGSRLSIVGGFSRAAAAAGAPQNSTGSANGSHLNNLTRDTYHHITSAEDVPSASKSMDLFSAARNGDLEELKLFLDMVHRRVQTSAESSMTAEKVLDEFEPTERLPVLCCAAVARKNKYQALHMVLNAGANVEGRDMRMGNTPLHLVCETAIPPVTDYQHPIRYTQDEHGSLVEPAGGSDDTEEPLQMLITTDDEPIAEISGGSGIQEEILDDADELNADEQDALARVKDDSESLFSILTNESAQRDAGGLYASPIPHRPSRSGSSGGAFYKMKNQILVKGGLEDQIRLLVLAGAPIDATNLRDETPLLMLIRHHDYVSALATLLRLGADPTIVAPFGPGTTNQPDGGSMANITAPKKLMRRKQTNKHSRFAKGGGGGGNASNGNGGANSSGANGRSSRLESPSVSTDHTLVMHGSALSHAAYYLRLQCVKYLLRHEIECSEPTNIERAIQACRQSVMVEANPSMVGLQTQILHILEREWSGEAGKVRRKQVAERVLGRKTKPVRSRVTMVATLVAAGEKTSEVMPMSPSLAAFPMPAPIIVPKPAIPSRSSLSTAAVHSATFDTVTSPTLTGLTSPTSRTGKTALPSLPPTPTSPLPSVPISDSLQARLPLQQQQQERVFISTNTTLSAASPRGSIGSAVSSVSSHSMGMHATPGATSSGTTNSYPSYAFTGYDATADPNFKLAESKSLFRKLRKTTK